MPIEKRSAPAREYEDTLKRIKDVISARIVQDDAGNILEVHVLAGPGRAVKYIARDVESTIIAAFGITIDRRKISIAQLGGGDVGRQEKRLQLEKVQIVSEPDGAQVDVFLKMGTSSVTGSSRGVPTTKSWLYLAAGATLNAVAQFLTPDITFNVEDSSINASRPSKIALVSIMVFSSGRQQLLTGSCPVSHDDREAIVKATLDALNRKFAQLLAGD